MKFFQKAKDGGKESHVTGFFFVEIKSLFSIVLLHFGDGTREAFHSRAFNALTWFLKGEVNEFRMEEGGSIFIKRFAASLKPKYTTRDNCHKVFSNGDTWALSFRGPWANTWREYLPSLKKFVTLTHGRKVVG
jgi:hypothetical protein